MREKLRDKGRIEDIIKYSENIRKMIDGVSYETFQNDILIYFAVMKNVEIVGEAAYMLSAEFKESHLRRLGRLFRACVTTWFMAMQTLTFTNYTAQQLMIYPSSDNRLKHIWLTRIGKNGKRIMCNPKQNSVW